MFTLTMRFTLPEDTDWSKIPALMEDRARNLYTNMPGLISKAFVYDPDTREYGGNYLWGAARANRCIPQIRHRRRSASKIRRTTYRVHRVAVYLDRGKVYVPAAAAKA